ncbi:TetR/AcrR family transcriptional regulator [Nocardia altamirensis]|uniref:TetR/AcrR family transcriptional regulator n=1 Tax=Nocardia altamirensis TaxID=472158 RepID=UPI00084060A7|nr:TetR/AcrR family transcriptional regulator [Nocardia altamirensis]
MGNREDLLAGARRCLFEKGYARTTVRDIAAAAGGVSMAAIGYHFGSKEALLNEALAEANREWGAELERALDDAAQPGATPLDRFATNWQAVIDSIGAHRGLWAATFDTLAQAGHDPKTRDQLADKLTEARGGLARLFEHLDEADTAQGRAVGALYQALLTGVAAQYLIDPDHAPTGAELAAALRTITG